MKRTGELTLGIIGIICSGLMTFLGLFFRWISSSEEVKSIALEEAANDPAVMQEDIDIVLNFMSGAGWAFIIAASLGVILGIIAVVSVKGNKNPKVAGWVFIGGALLVGIISVGFGFLPAILYLIAGIMCLVRKPPINSDDLNPTQI